MQVRSTATFNRLSPWLVIVTTCDTLRSYFITKEAQPPLRMNFRPGMRQKSVAKVSPSSSPMSTTVVLASWVGVKLASTNAVGTGRLNPVFRFPLDPEDTVSCSLK
jgi:hypothetical protein